MQKYLDTVDLVKVKEQAKKGIEAIKVKKETTRAINIRIAKDMYEKYI